MLVDHDQPDVVATSPPRRGTGRRGRVAMLALSLVLGVIGTVLLTGTLMLGSAGGTGPEVVAEVPVTGLDMLRQTSSNSPAVVADPTDPRVVAMANRIDAPGFGCALQMSGDGGRTWVGAAPLTALPTGADTCYGPEVAFDSDGTLHYLFIGLQGEGNEPMGAFLSTSRDQGRTFTAPRQVLGPLNFGVRMAIDPKTHRMHIVWLHATSDPPTGGFVAEPNPIMAAYSDNGGVTFSTPVQVSDPARARVVGPALTMGPDSVVHVGYYDLEDDARDYQGLEGPVWEGTWSVVVATSVDGGARFGPGVVVDDQITPPERPILIFTMPPPALAVDRDRMCAAWTDGRNGDADVLLRCSTDGGARWADVRRINDDPVGNGIRQYLPRLSLAPGGRLDAAFLDRRYHPNNDRIDVSYTSSIDGGRSFAPNLRLTSKHSSALIGAQYEGPSAEDKFEIGSRLGLLSRRSGVLVAWPDSRNSVISGTGQDLFAAEVSLGVSEQPAWARGLGATLLSSGILVLAVVIRRRRRPHAAHDPVGDGAAAAGSDESVPEPVGGRRGLRLGPMLVVALPAVIGAATFVALAPARGAAFPGPQVVDMTMREYGFDYRPPAQGGRIVFNVRNTGTQEHRSGIYPLPDDMPPIDVQLRGTERRNVERLADPLPLKPGESHSFAVDLVAGQRYAILCFLPTEDRKKTHAQVGMTSEFRIGQ